MNITAHNILESWVSAARGFIADDITAQDIIKHCYRLHYEFDCEFNFWFDCSTTFLLFCVFFVLFCFSQSPCLVMGPLIKKLWAELAVENHACKVDLEHIFELPCFRSFPEEWKHGWMRILSSVRVLWNWNVLPYSMKAEDLTLPDSLLLPVSALLLFWCILGSSNSTISPSLLCSYFILLFSGWLCPFHTCFVSVTYSWYTIEVFSHGFLSFTHSTQLEYFLVVCCVCAVAVILLKTTKRFVFFL